MAGKRCITKLPITTVCAAKSPLYWNRCTVEKRLALHDGALCFLHVMRHYFVIVHGILAWTMRVGVDDRLRDPIYTMKQAMAYFLCDCMRPGQCHFCSHLNVHHNVQCVP